MIRGPMTFRLKIMLLVSVTTGAALCIGWVAIVMTHLVELRSNVVREASIQADIVGLSCAEAIASDDAAAVHDVVEKMLVDARVFGARVRRPDGTLVGEAWRAGMTPSEIEFDGPSEVVSGRVLHLARSIDVDGRTLGRIEVCFDLTPMLAQFRRESSVLLIVMGSVLIVSFLISARLQRVVTRPVHHLADVANRVTREGDFSLRATRTSADELGALTDAFNGMLEQIQQRDRELEESRSDLERRVRLRTTDLVIANAQLQGEVRDRREAEAQARKAQALLEAALHHTPAGILVADAPDVTIRLANAAALAILGRDEPDLEGIAAHEDVEQWTTFHPDGTPFDPRELPLSRAVLDGETSDNVEIIIRVPHREDRWVTVNAAPVRNAQGEVTSGVVVFLDITEMKQAEAERLEMNQRLLETSRLAGMAEVATDVLHNVGNVLNSVNVSSTLVNERLRASRAGDVALIAKLLGDHADDLATYLTDDEKGRLIPTYLDELGQVLADERATLADEVSQMTRCIDHIKEVVSMQQSYSKVSGVIEPVSIADLIDDAVRMTAASYERHGVALERDFEEVPMVTTDRHKVLQVVVNLLSNAKYAVEGNAVGERRVRMRLTREGDDDDARVRLAVEDNGMGIAEENLARIFSHGFTTRREGHGFGLHSGALTAKVLGGALTASSPGLGRGATFTLDLPIETKEACA